MPGGIGVSKNALQSKLNKQNNTVDLGGVHRDIGKVKQMVVDVEANVKTSVVQQLKLLEGRIDEKLANVTKPFVSRLN